MARHLYCDAMGCLQLGRPTPTSEFCQRRALEAEGKEPAEPDAKAILAAGRDDRRVRDPVFPRVRGAEGEKHSLPPHCPSGTRGQTVRDNNRYQQLHAVSFSGRGQKALRIGR